MGSINIRNSENEIRQIIDERSQAVKNKNLAKLFADDSEQILSFDVVIPLRYQGLHEVKERAGQWLSSFDGDIGHEVLDVNVVTDANLGFAHFLTHVSGFSKTGDLINMWFRTTTCFQKINEQWKIVHEHNSVPFDPDTGKAALNLRP